MTGRLLEVLLVDILELQVRTRTQSTQCGATNIQLDAQLDADVELNGYGA